MNILRIQALAFLFFFPLLSQAQNAIEPYIGYSIDLGNKPSFSQVNIGLQYPVINYRVYQMLIRVQGGLPLNKPTENDMAYTSDLSLPLNITTGYQSKWYTAAFIIGNRFKMISWAGKNTISPFVNAGVAYQKIAVGYNSYDMDKYTVLNPHRSLKKIGFCFGGGIRYKRDLNKGSVFLQAEFLSPLLINNINNYSYKLPLPLSINVEYVIEFKKRNK